MMMECPRCGFVQPKDRFCAKCGLDVDHFVVKPKPLWVRILQNPNLYLLLIGILILMMVGYILYLRTTSLRREVKALFQGTPLSSREAGDPSVAQKVRVEREVDASEPKQDTSMPEAPLGAPVETTVAAASAPIEASKVEVTSWEVPHETIMKLIASGEKIAASNDGLAYLWAQSSKPVEALANSGRKGTMRSVNLQNGAQFSFETLASASESFQFGLYFQFTKPEGKDWNLKWESTMVLPPPETPAEAASQNPVVKAFNESRLNGETILSPQGTFLIIFDPATRNPREELITKAGDGPWSIFKSEDFRTGGTDWVFLIQFK